MSYRELEKGLAIFSDDRIYRYALSRTWDAEKPVALFIGLNPSTADENKLDPTLRRVISFATRENCGGFVMGNLFAFRSTDPRGMKQARDPVGPDNDAWLARLMANAELVICGWGSHGSFAQRSTHIRSLLRNVKDKVRCLGLTASGEPRHPLYLPATTPMLPYPGI